MGATSHATVVGAGLAGLSATLTLARAGLAVTLVSPYPSERAQSVLAEGGINAALDVMGEHDTIAEHVADTLAGGANLAHAGAVRGLAASAPGIVFELARLGVPFNAEHGHIVQRNFGGQRKKRTAYAQSSTGKALVTALVDAVRRYEAAGLVTRLANHALAAIDVGATGACTGVVVCDAHTGATIALPAPVILATGGFAGLFGSITTGTTTNTGDATALALAAGVELANLEFIQYHPTTVAIAGKRLLVSEAARGEGGRLMTMRDGAPWYFMEELHPDVGNLATRDVVSREVAAVIANPRCDGVVRLDLTGLAPAVWRDRLGDLRDECIHYLGIDPARTPVSVEPGIHYCMGGINVDRGHRTSMAALYAAGECACAYHGANRLGGNSLLGAIYGGRTAAESVLADARSGGGDVAATDGAATACGRVAAGGAHVGKGNVMATDGAVTECGCVAAGGVIKGGSVGSADETVGSAIVPNHAVHLIDAPTVDLPADAGCDRAMQAILASSLGIRRTGERLSAALGELDELASASPDVSARQRNRLLLARAAISCALARCESRGAHWRDDFPATDDAYRATTVVRLVDGALDVSFVPVGEGTGSGDGAVGNAGAVGNGAGVACTGKGADAGGDGVSPAGAGAAGAASAGAASGMGVACTGKGEGTVGNAGTGGGTVERTDDAREGEVGHDA